MSYLDEWRRSIRPLAAASLATGTSLSLFAYTNSVFAPHLIKEFGWSRAQFSLIAVTMLLTLPILPLVGDQDYAYRALHSFLGYTAFSGAVINDGDIVGDRDPGRIVVRTYETTAVPERTSARERRREINAELICGDGRPRRCPIRR